MNFSSEPSRSLTSQKLFSSLRIRRSTVINVHPPDNIRYLSNVRPQAAIGLALSLLEIKYIGGEGLINAKVTGCALNVALVNREARNPLPFHSRIEFPVRETIPRTSRKGGSSSLTLPVFCDVAASLSRGRISAGVGRDEIAEQPRVARSATRTSTIKRNGKSGKD